jgi:hypothetical protein
MLLTTLLNYVILYTQKKSFTTKEGVDMTYNFSEEELKRIDKKAVLNLIAINEQRLNVWSIPQHEKDQIKKEIKQLKELLKNN